MSVSMGITYAAGIVQVEAAVEAAKSPGYSINQLSTIVKVVRDLYTKTQNAADAERLQKADRALFDNYGASHNVNMANVHARNWMGDMQPKGNAAVASKGGLSKSGSVKVNS